MSDRFVFPKLKDLGLENASWITTNNGCTCICKTSAEDYSQKRTSCPDICVLLPGFIIIYDPHLDSYFSPLRRLEYDGNTTGRTHPYSSEREPLHVVNVLFCRLWTKHPSAINRRRYHSSKLNIRCGLIKVYSPRNTLAYDPKSPQHRPGASVK